ncbi:UDP-N-acetylmuramoyl-tripeptide--D-alanyl-D-alanine ligase [bacterium]|nr:UDP-N-acetylmuramoyl-tripeptide--D-alanyl-D-alanine ligase [bacterium]
MNKPTFKWLADVLKADCGKASDVPIYNISIDSRTLKAGDLFWAIESKRDGHEFVADAFAKGASFAVVSKVWGQTETARGYRDRLIQVENTLEVLTAAAKSWRTKLDFPVIAITGSNGKTTTKDILIHLLKSRYKVTGTAGNLNNELGVPLTLLRIATDDEIAVIEMGAAKAGDIAHLCEITEPTHGLITSIGMAHMAGFKSLEGVAKTKGELFDYLEMRGTGFVPVDDPLCLEKSKILKKKTGFGFGEAPATWFNGYLRGTDYRINNSGCAEFIAENHPVRLTVPGKPIAQAALAAITIAKHFNVDIEESVSRLNSVTLTDGRASIFRIGNMTILDDSYNANPVSAQAALETLASMPGDSKTVILGDMNELGEYEEQAHRDLGKRLKQLSIHKAVFVGPLARFAADESRKLGINTLYYFSYEELEPILLNLIQDTEVLLIKASRTIGLERVVVQLKRMLS